MLVRVFCGDSTHQPLLLIALAFELNTGPTAKFGLGTIRAAMAARSRVLAYRRVQFTVGDRLSTSFAEHSGIVMAIVRGESEHAAEQIRDHVLSAHRTSQNYLERRAPREEDDQSSQVS